MIVEASATSSLKLGGFDSTTLPRACIGSLLGDRFGGRQQPSVSQANARTPR
jgi:hypothetical protein